ncbi:MAG: CBS domain-containing protein [SAR202 cluster bacterium]|nr:CBS domain-containing protein [SAR202 cluster bacterium]
MKSSDEKINLALEGLRILAFGSIACSYITASWIVFDSTDQVWVWLLIASILNFIVILILRSISIRIAPLVFNRIGKFNSILIKLVSLISFVSVPIDVISHSLIGMLKVFSKSQNLDNISPSEIDSFFELEGESLDEREVKMIQAVVRQDKTVVREIMVPRVDVTAVEINTPIVELADIMLESGHSKIPVFTDELDQISGVAYSMDLIGALKAQGSESVKLDSLLRAPLLIPESKTLEGLLREFQNKRVQLAIVVDEYGGVSGVVTIEDLLEEIVGEIEDEFDIDEPEIVNLSDYTNKDDHLDLLIDARVSIDQLEELTGIIVEGEGFDTLGGLVLDLLGRMPNKGDIVEYNGITIHVISTSGRRLKRLRVNRVSS